MQSKYDIWKTTDPFEESLPIHESDDFEEHIEGLMNSLYNEASLEASAIEALYNSMSKPKIEE